LAGLAKNERELLLVYLRQVGPKVATDIQKGARVWGRSDGSEVSRCAGTRGEARKVLCELEATASLGKALTPSRQTHGEGGGGEPGAGGGGGEHRPKGGGKGGGGGQNGGDYERLVCRSIRDTGAFFYGEACRYSHDRSAAAEEKKKLKTGGGGNPPLGAVGKPKGKGGSKGGKEGKGKRDGKCDGKKGGDKRQPPGVSRVEFSKKLCPASRKVRIAGSAWIAVSCAKKQV
jgi:hypothetical protein